MNHFSLTITSESDNIRKIENFIECIMDEFHIPEKLHARIKLPIIEAVTNTTLFGSKNDSQKSIKLYAVKGSRKMVITIEEEGKGMDLSKLPDILGIEELMEKMGRGLYLMIYLPDELIFAKNRTKVIMTYDLNKITYERLCTGGTCL